MKPTTAIITLSMVGIISYFILKTIKRVAPVDVIIDLSPIEPLAKPSANPSEVSAAPINEIVIDELAPYDRSGFGIDNHRNSDDHELDDYLNLPLVGSGKTYSNSSMADIDIIPIPNSVNKYKYIRFSVKETRGLMPIVSIGHIYFYSGLDQIKDIDVSIWNPHTGESSVYTGSWTDSNMKTIIFCFSKAQKITRYDIKTSFQPPANDPSMWSLEGSKNGSYWIPIHNADEDLPILRGKIMYFLL